jgi:hypothetical protein
VAFIPSKYALPYGIKTGFLPTGRHRIKQQAKKGKGYGVFKRVIR